MPAARLSAQEYIQQLRAQRAEKQTATTADSSLTSTASTTQTSPVTEAPTETVVAPTSTPPTVTPTEPQTSATPPTVNPPSITIPTAATPTSTPDPDPAPPQVTPIEQIVLEWKAPNRPFKKRDRRYYLTVGTIVFLISLILFFAGQFLPIAVVISVAFLSYVLSAVPPVIINHQLTNFGLRIDDELYGWEELGRFWLTKKYGQNVLNIEVARFPWRLAVLLGDMPADKMSDMFGVILVKEVPKPTFYDRASEWLQKMIPLDND